MLPEAEQLTPEQRRKVRHLKVFFLTSGAGAMLGLGLLLLRLPIEVIALTTLALAVFGILVVLFFSGTSRVLDRFTSSPRDGEDGEGCH